MRDRCCRFCRIVTNDGFIRVTMSRDGANAYGGSPLGVGGSTVRKDVRN